jgi:hypothetical protein
MCAAVAPHQVEPYGPTLSAHERPTVYACHRGKPVGKLRTMPMARAHAGQEAAGPFCSHGVGGLRLGVSRPGFPAGLSSMALWREWISITPKGEGLVRLQSAAVQPRSTQESAPPSDSARHQAAWRAQEPATAFPLVVCSGVG